MVSPVAHPRWSRRLVGGSIGVDRVSIRRHAVVSGVDGCDSVVVSVLMIVARELAHHTPSSSPSPSICIMEAIDVRPSCAVVSVVVVTAVAMAMPTIIIATCVYTSVTLHVVVELIAHDTRATMATRRTLIESHCLAAKTVCCVERCTAIGFLETPAGLPRKDS